MGSLVGGFGLQTWHAGVESCFQLAVLGPQDGMQQSQTPGRFVWVRMLRTEEFHFLRDSCGTFGAD